MILKYASIPIRVLLPLLLTRRSFKLLLLVGFLFLLMGCSNRVPFQEGYAQIKVEATLAKYEIVKSTIGGLNSTTSTIPDYLKETPPKLTPGELTALRAFLERTNCTLAPDDLKDQCYRATVIYLIQLANRYDDLGDQLYAAKVTVQSLMGILERVNKLLLDQPYDSIPFELEE